MYKVYRQKDHLFLKEFTSRSDAVFFCMVQTTLPKPDYEWSDEFYIIEPNGKSWEFIE